MNTTALRLWEAIKESKTDVSNQSLSQARTTVTVRAVFCTTNLQASCPAKLHTQQPAVQLHTQSPLGQPLFREFSFPNLLAAFFCLLSSLQKQAFLPALLLQKWALFIAVSCFFTAFTVFLTEQLTTDCSLWIQSKFSLFLSNNKIVTVSHTLLRWWWTGLKHVKREKDSERE